MSTPVVLLPILRRRAATIALMTLLSGVGSSAMLIWEKRLEIFYWESFAELEEVPADHDDPFGFAEKKIELRLHLSKRMSWLPGPSRVSTPIDRTTFEQLQEVAIDRAIAVGGEEWVALYFAPPAFPRLSPTRLAECYDLPLSVLPLTGQGLPDDHSTTPPNAP